MQIYKAEDSEKNNTESDHGFFGRGGMMARRVRYNIKKKRARGGSDSDNGDDEGEKNVTKEEKEKRKLFQRN